jgi:hypothetical protein
MFVVIAGRDDDVYGPFKCIAAAELWAKLEFSGYNIGWVVKPLRTAE